MTGDIPRKAVIMKSHVLLEACMFFRLVPDRRERPLRTRTAHSESQLLILHAAASVANMR